MRIHGVTWILVMLGVLVLSPFLVAHTAYSECLTLELRDASRWYSDREIELVLHGGDRLYQTLLGDTGIAQSLRANFAQPVPSADILPGVKIPSHLVSYANYYLSGYWSALFDNIRLLCIRLAHWWRWVIYLLPFVAAIVFDGVMTRKAKLASFRYTSPTVYNLAWHLIIGILCFSLVYFSLALPISVFYYPVMLTGVGFLVSLVLANIQHSA
jgi:Domain of unknown function (DUF4400)